MKTHGRPALTKKARLEFGKKCKMSKKLFLWYSYPPTGTMMVAYVTTDCLI